MSELKNKVIIFDMDGVLFDTIPLAKQVFLDSHPGVTEEMYHEMHSGNIHVEGAKYVHLVREEAEEERQSRYAAYSKKKSLSRMFEGVKKLLEELLEAGYTLAVNSNAREENCLPLLENAGIRLLFDFISSAKTSKDKVEKFKIIAQKYKVLPEEMLFVTDALGDLRDADKAGVPTIAVTWGVHDKTYFEREHHSNLITVAAAVLELKNAILEQ